MYDILILGSSSKGNCAYVSTGDVKFLLDCGLSLKKTKTILHSKGISLSDIDYVLVTHEHIDHIKSLKQLVTTYDMKVIASRGTLQNVDLPKSNINYIKDGQELEFDDIKIKAKRVNHDANEPLCFAIRNSLDEKLLYLTDCGSLPDEDFENYDFYIVEANYSMEKLTFNYKNNMIHEVRYKRALTGMGHLNLDETIEFLDKNIGGNTKKIILSHLSSENSDSEEFEFSAKLRLDFQDIYIAKNDLHILCGTDPKPF